MSLIYDIVKVAAAVSAWCFVHSFLISESFSKRILPLPVSVRRFGRLSYNIFSLVTFILLIWYLGKFSAEPIFSFSGNMIAVQAALLIVSLYLFYAGASGYSMRAFTGIDQVVNKYGRKSLSATGELNTSGILKHTRHPWYLGALLFIWSVEKDIDIYRLTTLIIFSIYIITGTILEERKLLKQFGAQYETYMNEVSMLIPVKSVYKLFSRNRV